ncbi:hypothetical protein DYD21_20700 [Rhodohalobacter sp. SW132]|uniref:hypothetical protein n=1 Tax=Rhodohalobacter sp. SW132 TaxID=2293433 RepID=UPI000E21FCAF|nr:hypothetical protein [Rhodohalobacter sp. SW132]REL23925.1 hypothetical protein DYD21_20700 [Rhodohalobacter sp. SW132]
MNLRLLSQEIVFSDYPRNEVDIEMEDGQLVTYYVDNRKILIAQNSVQEITQDLDVLAKNNPNAISAIIYEAKNTSERIFLKKINLKNN